MRWQSCPSLKERRIQDSGRTTRRAAYKFNFTAPFLRLKRDTEKKLDRAKKAAAPHAGGAQIKELRPAASSISLAHTLCTHAHRRRHRGAALRDRARPALLHCHHRPCGGFGSLSGAPILNANICFQDRPRAIFSLCPCPLRRRQRSRLLQHSERPIATATATWTGTRW